MPKERTKPAAWSAEASRMLIPTSGPAPPSRCWAATTSGASARHGVHHEPQTTTTTGLPRSPARSSGAPSRSLPPSSTGSPRSAADTWLIAPSPVTKPLSPVPCSDVQPVRSSTQARSGPRARRRSDISGLVLLGGSPGRERSGLVTRRDQVTGGLGVGDLREPVPHEVQGRQRAQRALPPARVVEEGALLHVQSGDPDGQLVGDDDRLVAGG